MTIGGPEGDHDCGSDAAAYALGALEPEQAEAFARHLESCAICRDEVAAFGLVLDALPLAADQFEAPRRLRRRVLRAIREEPRRAPARDAWRQRRPALAAAVALAAVVATALAVGLGTGGSGERLFRAGIGDAQLRVQGDHAVLVVKHLPPPGTGRIYEMWLQHGAGAPQPSTLFSVDTRGGADIGVPGSVTGVRRVLVTNEPAQGTRTPTTTPLIVATIS